MNIDLPGFYLYPESPVEFAGSTYALVRSAQGQKYLALSGDGAGFEGQTPADGGPLLCPLTPANAAALRRRLPWLNPAALGLCTSAGLGDRLGLATPGHIHAVRATGVAPVFAQQSVRENVRTGRTPQQVLDDAMWAVFQEGWREPWGADADHLKTPADLPAFVAAGYSFFTIDPGEHVAAVPATAALDELRALAAGLPWPALDDTLEGCCERYLNAPLPDGLPLTLDETALLRTLVKYGGAIAHVRSMYQALQGQCPRPFDFEVSVDETDWPTSPEEHYIIAAELRRLGVVWVSLAPRFVGRFEKGVDYIGDLAEFETELARHAAVQRYFGSYKLSLHSGSDKFSIYAQAAAATAGRVHLKTAGTSYLEALRVLALVAPALFRQVMQFSLDRYTTDRQSYHVSAEAGRVPPLDTLADADLASLLDQFDARQVLHVAFGSVLARFGGEIKATLIANEDLYAVTLRRHFDRHLAPFQQAR